MHKLKAPNSYVILMMIIAVMAILSWVIPGGAYDYVDPNADKLEPIAGTYHSIESNPQGLWAIIMAPISGFMDSVDIISLLSRNRWLSCYCNAFRCIRRCNRSHSKKTLTGKNSYSSLSSC